MALLSSRRCRSEVSLSEAATWAEERSADAAPSCSRTPKGSGRIRVRIEPGKQRLLMRAWSTTLELKQRLREEHAVPVQWMRLFHGSTGPELHNSQRLIELTGRRQATNRGSRNAPSPASRTVCVVLKVQNPRDFSRGYYIAAWGAADHGIDEARASLASHEQQKLLVPVQQGLAMGLTPQLVWGGTGGCYVLRDANRVPVAAFKPRDEEAFAPNNPRGLQGRMGGPGIHPYVESGDAYVREVLVHQLDHHRFASVPFTMAAECLHPAFFVSSLGPLSRYGSKLGSLQTWVRHDDLASDRGAITFPADQVHRIAILDMRLLNQDRNDGNILVCDDDDEHLRLPSADTSRDDLSSYDPTASRDGDADGEAAAAAAAAAAEADEENGHALWRAHAGGTRDSRRPSRLVPIDHGGCLPTRPEVVWYNWCWLSWPQMHAPISAEVREYIRALEPARESKLLLDAGLPPEVARVSRCSTLVLQRGVAAGLTLHEVALLLCRQDDERPSELEQLWRAAFKLSHSALHNHRLLGATTPTLGSRSAPPSPSKAAQPSQLQPRVPSPPSSPPSSPLSSPALTRAAVEQKRAAAAVGVAGGVPSTASLPGIRRVTSEQSGLGEDRRFDRLLTAGVDEPDDRPGAMEAVFQGYFERLLDELLKRSVSSRRPAV